ncbi:hypothetical protein A0H81_06768 [Grifola frondosa]|uniref:Uncharacterized protein n=1 Tax=Grifola frondosa TaxID=5627 RepID=A0A1C7M9P3_GRIFR|nr:hypothetical protein A0H81_06768 [Grifola frondosa]
MNDYVDACKQLRISVQSHTLALPSGPTATATASTSSSGLESTTSNVAGVGAAVSTVVIAGFSASFIIPLYISFISRTQCSKTNHYI